MKMNNNKREIKLWTLILFLTCVFLSNVHAQVYEFQNSVDSASIRMGAPVSRENIPWYVKTIDKSADTVHMRHYYPNVNLIKYPLFEYRVFQERVPTLEEGEKMPEYLWDLPLRIVNDPLGRDSITLRELTVDKLLILDIWASYCSPCFESMHNWEKIVPHYRKQVQVVGLMLDYDFQAEKIIKERGWTIPQIVGPEAYLLCYFFTKPAAIGPSLWIKDKHFIGATPPRHDNTELLRALVKGELNTIPDTSRFKGYDLRVKRQ